MVRRIEGGMLNIPTDLLRTLVAVVDLRSFTKAAHSLGITQPAVSAQIKRLQFLLGCELFDKSAPGVSLTPQGNDVIMAARRMLAINDEILRASSGAPRAETLRLAIPGDFCGVRIPQVLADFRKRWPYVCFNVGAAGCEPPMRDLKQGELDLVVAVARSPLPSQARHLWLDQAVWVRSEATRLSPHGPVPLISFGEDCACRQSAVQALSRIGRGCNLVLTSRSPVSLEAAVVAGLGVMVLPRSCVEFAGLAVWEDAPLPQLPELHCGLFLREGEDRPELLELADDIAAALRPQLRFAEAVAGPVRASGSG
jgi:DNA-binding transcriptional LysR family regulator